MTRLTRLTLTTFLSAGLAAGAVAQETHPETGDTLAADQTFTYRILDNISSIDPQIVEDTDGSDVVRDLFEGLLNQDENGELVPGVATDWEVSDDKMTYTFHLRDDAKWSNGDPVTAGDFVYAWRRAADPATASPYQWFISLMSLENGDAVVAGDMAPEELGVEAIDDTTLEVRLTSPLPYFPQMVVHSTTFPSPQSVIEEHGSAWTNPANFVGNGAFVLTEMNPGESIVREKNDQYWDAENVILDKSVALIINDENVALTRYRAGELDMTDIPAGQFPRLRDEYGEEAHSFPKLCNYYYTFNLSDSGPEAFKDPKVRRALALAVDRDIIVNNVMAGGQPPAYVFTPEATAGFEAPETELASMTQSERDERARELLAEAGYGEDNPLTFDMVYNTSEAHQKVAVVLSQMWKQKLGVQAQLSNMEWKVFLEERGNQNFEMARGAWCGDYNEASSFLDLLQSDSGYNDGKYSNPEYDQLLEDALTADDTTPLYTRAEEILAEDMPVIPLYHYAGVYMIDESLKNFPVNNIQFNWYSKDLYKAAE
ncbi:peptide ABC transporter substrate-binding protein [Salipiger bermudensis]|uniref:peptide ABC transporter substrate-binding protein n=1 Tax=Salipiger bermudensis TaxID=344736 RepID=UPI001CD39CE0|nr:peptide ABC transporter substrate-binding protein [Salipiger bermudensis]MCA0961791.1 peptide ABC transporter substrate-binding protein [Salipiger bermudensis]